MPTISLIPTGCTIVIDCGDHRSDWSALMGKTEGPFEPEYGQYLHYSVNAPKSFRQTVRLTTDEKFDQLKGSVTVKLLDSAVEGARGVGRLGYWEKDTENGYVRSPANYLAEVSIPNQQFNELLAAARVGRLPKEIFITVAGEGIKYGDEPDGSGKDWDNKKFPFLLVKEVNFVVPLVAPRFDEDGELTEKHLGESLPPSRAQLDQLLLAISGFRRLFIWLAVGLAIVIFFSSK